MPCCGGGCTPVLNLQNKKGETKAVVKGPCCCVSDLCGANFEVQTPEGKSIGDVKKLGVQSVSDAVVEATTDADNFMISFPKDVNVEQPSPRGHSADGSRRRCGCDVDIPWRQVAATPRRGREAEIRSRPARAFLRYKALMLSSLLLLDYMFFESEGAFQFEPRRARVVATPPLTPSPRRRGRDAATGDQRPHTGGTVCAFFAAACATAAAASRRARATARPRTRRTTRIKARRSRATSPTTPRPPRRPSSSPSPSPSKRPRGDPSPSVGPGLLAPRSRAGVKKSRPRSIARSIKPSWSTPRAYTFFYRRSRRAPSPRGT